MDMEEDRILRLTEEDASVVCCAPVALNFRELAFAGALLVRCASPISVLVPNSGELIAAALVRAYISAFGWDHIRLPPNRSIYAWPPREAIYLWAALCRVSETVQEDPRQPLTWRDPTRVFLRLLRPEWDHDGSDDDSSLFTPAGKFFDFWRPSQDAGASSSGLRQRAVEEGKEYYAGLPAEHCEFVDMLAPFGPAAFKKVLEKGGGW